MELKLNEKERALLYRLVRERNISGIESFLSTIFRKKVKVWDAEVRKDGTIVIYLGRSI